MAKVSGRAISHTHFASLKVKDAVCDQFRDSVGVRPSVDVKTPSVRIHVHLHNADAYIYLDLAGDGLHRRGYRLDGGGAPLKENLAAALLLRAGWPTLAQEHAGLFDPMCGSGTLLIEGALLAADRAPGLKRGYFGFLGWKQHDAKLWEKLLAEAMERAEQGLEKIGCIAGSDVNKRAVAAARKNIVRAGLQGKVRVETLCVSKAEPPADAPGLVITNPPYGERMSAATQLEPLYSVLGGRLRPCFKGWKVAVLTGDAEASRALGLAIQRKNRFYNADLPVTLLRSEIYLDRPDAEPDGGKEAAAPGTKASTRNTSKDWTPTTKKSKNAPKTGSGFRTRLQKNLEELRPWADRAGIRCYRLYNRDVPEYAVAIDLFDGWVYVQAYEAPRSVDPKLARDRLREVLQAIPEVLQIGPDRVYLKERRRQRGRQQYEKLAEKSELRGVREDGHRFLVNLTDYLDTGLFLDHRKTRAMVGSLAHDRRFLNLFAYTGTATVYAVRGGAAETVTVDISNTYTEWSEKNLKENGIAVGERHSIVRDDCLAALTRDRQQRYGLIFCDPPRFSNSKKMRRPFDVQKDHVWLLKKTARLLDRNGILLFSNNYRKFVMDRDSLKELEIEDITAKTLPRDFERTPNIHNCWRITRSR